MKRLLSTTLHSQLASAQYLRKMVFEKFAKGLKTKICPLFAILSRAYRSTQPEIQSPYLEMVAPEMNLIAPQT